MTLGSTFHTGTRGTIFLTTDALTINKNLTIHGPGPDNQAIVIEGSAFQIFAIALGVSVKISELMLANAKTYYADNGGAIYNQGNLAVTFFTFSGNSTLLHGGGIYNTSVGKATIDSCAFDGNSAHNAARPADRDVVGYDTGTAKIVFDSGPLIGADVPDGIVFGTGPLAGHLYVNTWGGATL